MSASLPPAPTSIADAAGRPRFGTYQGTLDEVDWRTLGGDYRASLPRRLVRQKRWVYAFTATPEVMALFAIADLGYSASAFAMVLDRVQKRVLFDRSWLGPPGPLVRVSPRPFRGLFAKFRAVGASLACECSPKADRFDIEVTASSMPWGLGALKWNAALSLEGASPITVIAPVPNGGVVNVTQKAGALQVSGTLQAGGRTFRLDGGVGGTDYTHGLLARRTCWRWAFACGRLPDGTPLSLNLVEGFNDSSQGANENALWLGGRLLPLARAHFDYNRNDVLDPWQVRTADGAVELTFRPVAVHREQRTLGLVKSAFAQPVGQFSGRLRVDGQTLSLEGLAGVTEEQDVLW